MGATGVRGVGGVDGRHAGGRRAAEAGAGGPAAGRLGRRQVLVGAAGILGAAAALGLPAAGPVLAAAKPRRAAAATAVLYLSPESEIPTVGAAAWSIWQDGLGPFLRAHPGVEIRLYPNYGYQGATIARMLAGSGPDVFSDWIMDPFTSSGVVLDLAPYVRRDGVDLGAYESGQIGYYRAAALLSPDNPSGLYGLPAYVNLAASMVNLGILDALGLRYPEPGWTYADWTKLWESATARRAANGQPRYGGWIDWGGYDHSYNNPTAWVFRGWGGEYVDPQDPTRCFLSDPHSIACGTWAWGLIYDGVVANTTPASSDTVGAFRSGQMVYYLWDVFKLARSVAFDGLKWDLYFTPTGPVRTTSYTSSDFYAIWSGTRFPELAWDLVKYLCTDPHWQMVMARTYLRAPNRAALFPQWAEVVRRIAPPLRSKNIDVYVQQVAQNDLYVGGLFRYTNSSVMPVLQNLANDLQARRVSVADGFTAAARQIDAIERLGAAYTAAALKERSLYLAAVAASRAGRTPTLPPPPRSGLGAPPVAAPSLVSASGGRWTVTAGGSGVAGFTDGLTFAAAAETAGVAEFTCRLVAVQALHPDTLVDGAKFGLLARGDLGTEAAEVGVEVAAGRGVHVHARPLPGQALGDQRPASSAQAAGLLGAGVILRPDSSPAANFLLRPVWLRLRRDGVGRWTAYTSLDGRTWTQAGEPVGIQVLGAWVGLYATAHQNGNLVRAVFDQVTGFTPDTFVRVGAP